ncbi:MAG: cation:proton antiporter [Candidatus Woesearchaeota archaeon]
MLEHELMSLGILFLFAIIGGVIAAKLKQPPVIGLLLIGSLIGPHMFNLVKDTHMIEIMAELGSILLLFVIGLEFVIPKLLKIGFKALMVGIFKIGIFFFVLYEILILLGINQTAALLLGVMFSVSSTVVIVKVLESKGLYNREEVPLLIGVLLIEDLFAVIVMTFLSSAKSSFNIFNVFEKLIIALTLLTIVYLIVQKIAKIMIPKLLKEGNEEIVTFIALGICAGFSYLAYALGLQAATGAFLAGSIIASLSDAKLFEHAIKPYTLTFTSLFFISTGTMVNYSVILENFFLILVLLSTIIITTFLGIGFSTFLFANFKNHQAIFSSIAMISIGEFSLLISQIAMKLNLGIDFVSIASFIIFITAIIMSLLIGYYEKISEIVITKNSSFNNKPKSFSNFIRLLSDEIDTENMYTNHMKENFLKFLFKLMIISFLSIVYDKISLEKNIFLNIIFYTILIGIFIYSIKNLKVVSKNLKRIILNIYPGSSEKQISLIMQNILLAFIFLIITIFSPLFILIFKLPTWINIASFLLLILVILRFNRLFNIVHHTSKHVYFPRYKKINTLKFN